MTIEVDGISYTLLPMVNKPGNYYQPDLIVEQGKTYYLSVTTGLGVATAQTTVPILPQVSGATTDTTGLGALRDSIAQADQWRFMQDRSSTLNQGQFTYYGTYAFLVYMLDENYGDFLISSQQDEATLDEPRFHIAGGIGLFASMAADSVVFRVE